MGVTAFRQLSRTTAQQKVNAWRYLGVLQNFYLTCTADAYTHKTSKRLVMTDKH